MTSPTLAQPTGLPGRGTDKLTPVTGFPVVFLSYDEPWADANWQDLKSKVPTAKRVHGVKGLDACHKAAADAVTGDWLITVDADTIIGPGWNRIEIPEHLLTDTFRLDWLSRNSVNGLSSGNGCVKLWPKRIIRKMRTHEAAPDDVLSLDHDIETVVPGHSRKHLMPERVSVTYPALTPYHGFRAAFREACFLHQMAVAAAGRQNLDSWTRTEAARTLIIWASIGRHAPNGHWMLYGARLGLAMALADPAWDMRKVNDYDWFANLWQCDVLSRFATTTGAWPAWNWTSLETELAGLSSQIAMCCDIKIAEFPEQLSQTVAGSNMLSSQNPANRLDSIGYRLRKAAKSPGEFETARNYFETAMVFDHPAAFDNLGRLHHQGLIAGADAGTAEGLYRTAILLGNRYAPEHLAELTGQALRTKKRT